MHSSPISLMDLRPPHVLAEGGHFASEFSIQHQTLMEAHHKHGGGSLCRCGKSAFGKTPEKNPMIHRPHPQNLAWKCDVCLARLIWAQFFLHSFVAFVLVLQRRHPDWVWVVLPESTDRPDPTEWFESGPRNPCCLSHTARTAAATNRYEDLVVLLSRFP